MIRFITYPRTGHDTSSEGSLAGPFLDSIINSHAFGLIQISVTGADPSRSWTGTVSAVFPHGTWHSLSVAMTDSIGDDPLFLANDPVTLTFTPSAVAASVIHDNGNSGTAKTIDWTVSNIQGLTTTESCVASFVDPRTPGTVTLIITHDTSDYSFIYTWPASVVWPRETSFVTTNTSSAIDVISFLWDGIRYYGTGFADFSAFGYADSHSPSASISASPSVSSSSSPSRSPSSSPSASVSASPSISPSISPSASPSASPSS